MSALNDSLFIDGRWVPGSGPVLESRDPVTGESLWKGREASPDDVQAAVAAARRAFADWSQRKASERIRFLKAYEAGLKRAKASLSALIAAETGKPLWEALTEVTSMIKKVPISIKAFYDRTGPTRHALGKRTSRIRFKPHGVIAVLGPFNFPGHLPTGHIIPALIAGNTLIFKPSEHTPGVAHEIVRLFQAARIPPGVINLVQGGPATGKALLEAPELDGVFFTGSAKTGSLIHKSFADRPWVILALEMGGNNPLVVSDPPDIQAASFLTVQSAFITAGQRCSCARRLIVLDTEKGKAFLERLTADIKNLKAGHHTQRPEPFLGPVISQEAADRLIAAQERLVKNGATVLIEMKRLIKGTPLLSPGLIDVTAISKREDVELFGPLLQLIRVKDLHEAIAEANHTAYGLAAGIITGSRQTYEEFFRRVRAGIINWNTPLTGALSTAPFGGVGISGNHRPSAYFAADYCAYPVASLESEVPQMPNKKSQ